MKNLKHKIKILAIKFEFKLKILFIKLKYDIKKIALIITLTLFTFISYGQKTNNIITSDFKIVNNEIVDNQSIFFINENKTISLYSNEDVVFKIIKRYKYPNKILFYCIDERGYSAFFIIKRKVVKLYHNKDKITFLIPNNKFISLSEIDNPLYAIK